MVMAVSFISIFAGFHSAKVMVRRIVYQSNDRIQTYCSVFDGQAKRTVSSL